jgi:beta-glucanase (GH16 family)
MPSPRAVIGCLAATAAVSVKAADNCDCYTIDGDSSVRYKSYGFWDFRSLSQYAGVPALIDNFDDNQNADFTSDYFNQSSEFQEFWAPQKWSNENKILRTNSFNNLYIAPIEEGGSDTMLTLRTARGSNFQSTSAFQSKDFIDHASMRMYARTHGDSGACTSMFTYLGGDSIADVQESDIEVLTKESKDIINYTNQPAHMGNGTLVHGAGNKMKFPSGDTWTQWHTHRMDWTPGLVSWFLDGRELHSQSFQAPVDPSQIIFNAWSDGGNWTGLMEPDGQAFQDIQWIEIAYDLAEEGSCGNVCSVDEGAVGKPVAV